MRIVRSPRPSVTPTSPPPGELRASQWSGPLTDRDTLLRGSDTVEMRAERAVRGILRPEELERWPGDSFPRTAGTDAYRRFGVGQGVDTDAPIRKAGLAGAARADTLAFARRVRPRSTLAACAIWASKDRVSEWRPNAVLAAHAEDVAHRIAAERALPVLGGRPGPAPEIAQILTPSRVGRRFVAYGSLRVRRADAPALRRLVERWAELDPDGAREQMRDLRESVERTTVVFGDRRRPWCVWRRPVPWRLAARSRWTISAFHDVGMFEAPLPPFYGPRGGAAASGGSLLPPHVLFAHEVQHRAAGSMLNDHNGCRAPSAPATYGACRNANEATAIAYENLLSRAAGLIPRSTHTGTFVPMPDAASEIRVPIRRDGREGRLRPGEGVVGRLVSVDRETTRLETADGGQVDLPTATLLEAARPRPEYVLPREDDPTLQIRQRYGLDAQARRGEGLAMKPLVSPEARRRADVEQLACWRIAARRGERLEVTVPPDYGARVELATRPACRVDLRAGDDERVRATLTPLPEVELRVRPLIDGGVRIRRLPPGNDPAPLRVRYGAATGTA